MPGPESLLTLLRRCAGSAQMFTAAQISTTTYLHSSQSHSPTFSLSQSHSLTLTHAYTHPHSLTIAHSHPQAVWKIYAGTERNGTRNKREKV